MNRKNLLIISGLIGVIIVLLSIGLFISSNSTSTDNSTVISNSTNNSAEEYLAFDNSTPEATAISIARLNVGVHGFYTCHTVNASLTSDGKYWIVKMNENDPYNNWNVTVDAKTLMSKQEGDLNQRQNTWRSLDELKAAYIAEIRSESLSESKEVGKPHKIILNGKEIWKVPIYYYNDANQEQVEYIYVDLTTGKSKNTWDSFNEAAGTDGWLTLKEADDRSGLCLSSSGDALRNLYPE